MVCLNFSVFGQIQLPIGLNYSHWRSWMCMQSCDTYMCLGKAEYSLFCWGQIDSHSLFLLKIGLIIYFVWNGFFSFRVMNVHAVFWHVFWKGFTEIMMTLVLALNWPTSMSNKERRQGDKETSQCLHLVEFHSQNICQRLFFILFLFI